jgi:hypothetical protein
MTRYLKILALALLVAGSFLASNDAFAAVQNMCRGNAASTAQGPARWTAPGSGTAYSLDNFGCAPIALADISDAQAGGLVQAGPHRSIIYNTGVVTGTTDIIVGNVPANMHIREIIVSNSVAAAVTGGIDIGTTANGADVVSALAVGSSGLVFTADAALLKRVFSTTVATPIHFAAHTAWNSTNCTITIILGYF